MIEIESLCGRGSKTRGERDLKWNFWLVAIEVRLRLQ